MSEQESASGRREPAVMPVVEQPAHAGRSPRRRWLPLAAGVVGLVLLGFGLWFWVNRGSGDDLTRLQGEWRVRAANPDVTVLVRVEGDCWSYATGRHESSHRILLNPAANPKEIDLASLLPNGRPVLFTDGPGKGTEMKQLGVYALDGDRLTVALAPVQEGHRPKSLNDPDGPPPLILDRVKK